MNRIKNVMTFESSIINNEKYEMMKNFNKLSIYPNRCNEFMWKIHNTMLNMITLKIYGSDIEHVKECNLEKYITIGETTNYSSFNVIFKNVFNINKILIQNFHSYIFFIAYDINNNIIKPDDLKYSSNIVKYNFIDEKINNKTDVENIMDISTHIIDIISTIIRINI